MTEKKRKNRERIILSTEEILVMAGLLKYQSVLAISDETFYDFHTNPKTVIRQVMESFERRRIVFYNLDGELQIDKRYMMITRVICSPDFVLAVDGIFEGDKRRMTRYLAGSGEDWMTFFKNHDGMYEFVKIAKDEILNSLRNMFKDAEYPVIHEKIEMKSISEIQNKILSFQKDFAVEFLNEKLKEENAIEPIVSFLSQRGEYMRIQVHSRGEVIYRNVYNAFIVMDGKGFIKVSMDDNSIVHFDSIDFEKLVEEVMNSIEGKEK